MRTTKEKQTAARKWAEKYGARLLRLASFLKNLPRNRFAYNSFVGEDYKGAPDLSCGTTACALGWAAAMPEFRRLGLKLHKGRPVSYPVYKHDNGTDAACVPFGLTEEESCYLFLPHYNMERHDGVIVRAPRGDATAKQVARHIERFVKLKQKLLLHA